MQLETMILSVLTKDPEFAKKVRPHLKSEYFNSDSDKLVYQVLENFYTKYSTAPPKDSLLIDLESVENINENVYTDSVKVAKAIYESDFEYNHDWLIAETEKFCRDRAIFNAIMQSVKIINGEVKNKTESAIPDMLSKALSVGFDVQVGHDYFDDADARFEFYHKKEVRFKTGITLLNKITGGGFPTKSLILLMASSGGGKSAVKCSLAADMIRDGKNVLYITMELAEERVAERIDANLMNLPIAEIRTMPEKLFKDKINSLKSKSYGKLVIKEYPTGSATVDHFNALLEELKTKRGFVPDVVFVDYLQIVASATHRGNSSMNTYQMQKYVAEELRGFAVKHNVPVISSVQTNRSGYNVSDIDETSIADSAGIIFTADMILGVIRPEDLKEQGQVMFKQIKNRFGDPSMYQKFICGMDTSRMRVFDIDIAQPRDMNSQPSQSEAPTPKKGGSNKPKATDWDFG